MTEPDSGLWRYWSRKAAKLAEQIAEAEARADEWQRIAFKRGHLLDTIQQMDIDLFNRATERAKQ